MKTIELIGHVDESHRLHAEVPPFVLPGPVKLLVLVADGDNDYEWPTPDVTEEEWLQFVARSWQAELEDRRDDIYSLEDGEPR